MAWATLTDLRNALPQVPELGMQAILITGNPTGGGFTLAYEGVATAAIVPNATATTVQSALRAIPDIGNGGVNVRGRPGGPWIAMFQGVLTTDAGPLTLGANNLTGGTLPSVAIAPAMDSVLQDYLDRATDTLRQALRAMLADPTFDFAIAASAKIVMGYPTFLMSIPAHTAGSLTLVEAEIGTNPLTYAALTDGWSEDSDGRIYRAAGWSLQRYRITAQWGYGATIPPAIEQLCIEVAVNNYRTRDKGSYTESVGVSGSGEVRAISGLNRQQMSTLQAIAQTLWQVSI